MTVLPLTAVGNRLRRATTFAALSAWGVLVLASPALASSASGDDGEGVTQPLSKAHVLLVYVGIPLAIVAVIWLLASLPSMLKAPRYRPGLSWWAAPVWFGGPEAGAPAATTAANEPVGGTSARW